MTELTELKLGADPLTRVFISQQAAKAILRYRGKKENPPGLLLKRLERYAQNGFEAYEGKTEKPIRPEWDGVYRIGSPDTLFRLLGFYEDNTRHVFLLIDAYQKKGQKLTTPDRQKIDAIAQIKHDKSWRKK